MERILKDIYYKFYQIKHMSKFYFWAVSILALAVFTTHFLFLITTVKADCDPNNTDCQIQEKQQEIKQLQSQLAAAQQQEQSLKTELSKLDGQIQLTVLKIQEAQYEIKKLDSEITDLNGRIDRLSNTVDQMSQVLLNRIVSTYKYNNYDTVDLLFSSHGFSDLLERIKYIQVIQVNDKRTLYQLQATKDTYNDQKNDKQTREAQQQAIAKQMQNLQTQLDQQKKDKQTLLTQTQGSEVNYQHLIAQARAELSALSGFARSRSGGQISLVSHSDKSDNWGKYYNQRDQAWGINFIGSSSYQIWEVGCLITSAAMVASHFGGSQIPADIAADSGNFFGSTADALLNRPIANGHSAQHISNPTMDDLKTALSAGHAIIAGLSADGGPYPNHYSDHWVVLRSVDGDSFKINDPWYEGAMNVSLKDHYSGWSIIEARIYN